MRKDLEGQESSQSSVAVGSAVKNIEQKKASGCMNDCSLVMEGTEIQPQQQLDRSLEDTLNVCEATNQNIPSMLPPIFELADNEEDTNAHSKPVDKEQMASTIRICPAKRNADVVHTDTTANQEVKNSHLAGARSPPLDHLAHQDGDKMLRFCKLAESITELGIEHSMETFKDKIEELRYFEENGFSVQELQYWLNELIKIKSDYARNLEEKCKPVVQILEKEPSLAQMYLLLLQEGYKALAGLQMELVQRRWKRERILKEIEREEAELSRLENAGRRLKKAIHDDKQEIARILAEVHQKLGLI